MIAFQLAAGFLLQIVPCAFLCYLPFLDDFKLSRRALSMVLTGMLLILATIFSFISLYLSSIYTEINASLFAINMVFMGFLLICAAAFFVTVKASIAKKIFTFILAANYGLIISSGSNIFTASFLTLPNAHVGLPYDRKSLIFIVIATIFTLPIFLKLTNRLKQALHHVDNKLWISTSVVTFIYFLTFSFGMMSLDFDIYFTTATFALFSCLSLGMVSIYYFIFRLLSEITKTAETKRIADAIHFHMQLQSEQLKSMQSNVELARKIHHDFKHNLHTLAGLASSGDIEQIRLYLNECINNLPSITLQHICDEPSINALLQYYVAVAEEYAIAFEFRVDLPSEINISAVDLCVVLGNLLENAIEASKVDAKPFITLYIVQLKYNLAITVDNRFSGNIKKVDGKYLSTKKNGSGLGLLSVETIANRYDGGLSIEIDRCTFKASVILGNPELSPVSSTGTK